MILRVSLRNLLRTTAARKRFLVNARMHFLGSPEGITAAVIVLLFAAGLAAYLVNRPPSPSFSFELASFQLGTSQRTIDVSIRANRGTVELNQFFINNRTVYNWIADKHIIKEADLARCVLEYPWKMGEDYEIRVVATDGRYTELTASAPEVIPTLSMVAGDPNTSATAGLSKVSLTYSVDGHGIDNVHMLLFTYGAFQNLARPLYIFYDRNYMPDESIKRADAIVKFFQSYSLTVSKTDYKSLMNLSQATPEVVLILVDPLKDHLGRTLQNVIPAGLVDRDEDRWIGNESRYGRSLLFDWMVDKGLVLVTVGSLEPYKRLLYEDGTYGYAKDSRSPFDAQVFLTNASSEESIINGSLVLGNYYPPRISGSLGLSYREASLGFDRDAMKRNGLQYYVYGDYKLPLDGATLNLSLPVFIRVGKGGWLAMGDEELWLSDGQLAHDLFLICLQAVWGSDWGPNGWNWDSCAAFHQSSGILSVNGSLITESIPLELSGSQVVIRVVCLGYSQDLNKGVIVEKLFEYRIP